jgi:hypothetical protein
VSSARRARHTFAPRRRHQLPRWPGPTRTAAGWRRQQQHRRRQQQHRRRQPRAAAPRPPRRNALRGSAVCALGMCAAPAVRPERSTSRAAPREARPEALSFRGTFSRLLRGKSRQFLSGPRRDCRASVRLPSAGLFRKVTLSDLCAESDWRVWRAARNASSVNGGRLPYSLGTVANAA